ncbi:MAG: amidohydrolase family protein [Candidatus Heimdallarchaeota archaeon]|nr:amidohydrolase family protein [Candidatus Heimdallarchaeota archaeon]MCK4768844.1 amidohydrolase family protein [Candidatus Heimdallarchaeota archaeon]
MVAVRANALVGPDLQLMQDVLIQIDEKGVIMSISKEKKPAEYTLPPSYLLIPGFVNSHIHVGDAFLKDQAYNLSLEDTVGPKGIKHKKFGISSKEEKIDSIRNALEMLVQNGYTSFIDFREEGLLGISLLRDELSEFPIRGIILGRPTGDDFLTDVFNEGDGLGFADIFSFNQDNVKIIKLLKEKNPEKVISIHASESEDVVARSLSLYEMRDIELCSKYSIFDYIVHGTYANDEDFTILKQNNIGLVCCPISNIYYDLKIPPIETILKKGILLGLGTDNILTNNPNPFRLMSITLYTARINNQIISPKDILKAVTVNPGLLSKKKIGQIEEGYAADFVGIDMNTPNLKFSKDIYKAITMRAEPSDIGFQMYNGKIVKWKS